MKITRIPEGAIIVLSDREMSALTGLRYYMNMTLEKALEGQKNGGLSDIRIRNVVGHETYSAVIDLCITARAADEWRPDA